MTPQIKIALQFTAELSWLWLLHVAYLVRGRSRVAAAVVAGFKFISGRGKHPDSAMRDWLIGMELIAAVFFVLIAWSAAIESAISAN